jgi:putative cell wall-binding protein
MSKFKKIILCLILIISSLDSALAQDENYGKWIVYFGNQKINSKWLLQSDIQYRLNQIPGQKSQLLLRAGLGYNLTESNNNILLGLAYVQSNLEEGDEAKPTIN